MPGFPVGPRRNGTPGYAAIGEASVPVRFRHFVIAQGTRGSSHSKVSCSGGAGERLRGAGTSVALGGSGLLWAGGLGTAAGRSAVAGRRGRVPWPKPGPRQADAVLFRELADLAAIRFWYALGV